MNIILQLVIISVSNDDMSQESTDESDGDNHGVVFLNKTNFNLVSSSLHFRPFGKLCLSIPIYSFVSMPLIHPILEVDVQLLGNEFVNGCRECDRVLYVSIEDNHGRISRSLRMSCSLGVNNGGD